MLPIFTCQVRSPHRPVKHTRTIVTTRANPHPCRPIRSTTIWRPWRKVASRTRRIALLRSPAMPSAILRTVTSTRTCTRTWRSPDRRRCPVVRGRDRFSSAATRRTATPACMIIPMKTCASSVPVIGMILRPRGVPTRADTWPGATPRRGSTRTRTYTFRRTQSPGTRRSRRSRRYIYPGWHLGKGSPTSSSVGKWTIIRVTRSRSPATRRTRRPVWVWTEVPARGTRGDSTAEVSRTYLALRGRTWRLGKWVISMRIQRSAWSYLTRMMHVYCRVPKLSYYGFKVIW